MSFEIPQEQPTEIEQGKWFEFRGGEFLISHASNMRFQRAMNRLQKPFGRKVGTPAMDPKDTKTILIQAMAETIVLDWKGIKLNGEDAEYSTKLARMLLTNDPAFQEFAMSVSTELDNFVTEEAQEKGNS